jgi:hypothetical protein
MSFNPKNYPPSFFTRSQSNFSMKRQPFREVTRESATKVRSKAALVRAGLGPEMPETCQYLPENARPTCSHATVPCLVSCLRHYSRRGAGTSGGNEDATSCKSGSKIWLSDTGHTDPTTTSYQSSTSGPKNLSTVRED